MKDMSAGLTPFGHWLHRHEISYADAGEILGVSRAYVQMLAVGKATPRLSTLAVEIERWTRKTDRHDVVKVASWLPYCKKFKEFKHLL